MVHRQAGTCSLNREDTDPVTKISSHLARRVAQIRRETFGDDGIPYLAERLGLPALEASMVKPSAP